MQFASITVCGSDAIRSDRVANCNQAEHWSCYEGPNNRVHIIHCEIYFAWVSGDNLLSVTKMHILQGQQLKYHLQEIVSVVCGGVGGRAGFCSDAQLAAYSQ